MSTMTQDTPALRICRKIEAMTGNPAAQGLRMMIATEIGTAAAEFARDQVRELNRERRQLAAALGLSEVRLPQDIATIGEALRRALKFCDTVAGEEQEVTADDGEVLSSVEICLLAAKGWHVECGEQAWQDLLTPPAGRSEAEPERKAPVSREACIALARDLMEREQVDIGSGSTGRELERLFGAALYRAQLGQMGLPEARS